MKPNDRQRRDRMFVKLFLKSSPEEITDEDVAYFRDHPDMVEEITAPVNVHKLFLWAGGILGAVCVGVSKLIKFSSLAVLSEPVREFTIDIIFEAGVALIGAAVTAYILGILLNQQQDNAANWRSEIRCRIGESE